MWGFQESILKREDSDDLTSVSFSFGLLPLPFPPACDHQRWSSQRVSMWTSPMATSWLLQLCITEQKNT